MTIASRRSVVLPATRGLALEQLVALAGQLGAGAGNLAFALLMARLLDPGAFAALASLGALYLLLHMPIASLTAGSALDPELELRLRRLSAWVGAGFGVLLAALALPAAQLLHLSVPLVLLLALAAPGAGPLALARGRLYGTGRFGGLAASLLAEPLGRLALGGVLAPLLGPAGGGLALVAGGYLSLAVARRAARGSVAPAVGATAPPGHGAVTAFVLLAVVQNLDLVLANALLGREQAGLFAVLSTLGGIAAFATFTIPLVLLPRARRGRGAALAIALALAALLGGMTVLLVAAAPARIVETLFGSEYSEAAAVAVPYLAAMALLGVGRVLVAQRCAEGRGREALLVLGAAAGVQLLLIATNPRTAAGVAYATLAATALLVGVLVADTALELPALRRTWERILLALRQPVVLALLGLCAVALGLRLLSTRGLWVDEAISVAQAENSFGGMLHSLRTSDVHPPLYLALLWLDVRLFGTSELALRLPSTLAGVLLVPALYAAGRDLYDRRAGMAAAAFAVIAPQAVWYSQEARMYALFMLFAALALWGQVRAVRFGRARDWGLYAAASVALFWTQYFSVLVIAVQQLAFAVVAWRQGSARRLLRGWAVSTVAIVALVALLVPFAYDQYSVNQAAGRGFGSTPSQAGGTLAREPHPSLYAFLANAVWAVWGYHADATMVDLVALWPLGMLLALFLLGRRFRGTSVLLLAVALLPALVLFAVGQTKSDLFDLRYFIASVPATLLLLGRGLTVWSASRLARIGLAGVLAASLLAGLVDQQLNRDNPRRYDFRGALQAIEARAHPHDLVIYNPSYLRETVRYYAPRLDARSLAEGLPARTRRGSVFVLASFFDKPEVATATQRAVQQLSRTRELVAGPRGTNVRVWQFR